MTKKVCQTLVFFCWQGENPCRTNVYLYLCLNLAWDLCLSLWLLSADMKWCKHCDKSIYNVQMHCSTSWYHQVPCQASASSRLPELSPARPGHKSPPRDKRRSKPTNNKQPTNNNKQPTTNNGSATMQPATNNDQQHHPPFMAWIRLGLFACSGNPCTQSPHFRIFAESLSLQNMFQINYIITVSSEHVPTKSENHTNSCCASFATPQFSSDFRLSPAAWWAWRPELVKCSSSNNPCKWNMFNLL